MSSPHDDDQDAAARRIKHGVKPGKSGDDDDADQPTAAGSSKGFGGLTNIGPRPPAPGSPKPPAPKPATPSPAAPKPSTPAAPKPPAPAAPKPPAPAAAPKPPTSAAAPKPPTSAAPKPVAPKPPTPGPSSAGSTGPTSAAGPIKDGQSLGGSLTMKDLRTLRVGGTAYVQQAGGKNLRLRNAPGLDSTVLDGLAPGTRMTLLAGPRADDGYDWWQIRTDDGREGWVAGSELVTQPED